MNARTTALIANITLAVVIFGGTAILVFAKDRSPLWFLLAAGVYMALHFRPYEPTKKPKDEPFRPYDH